MRRKRVCIIVNGKSTLSFRGNLIRKLLESTKVHLMLPFSLAAEEKDKLIEMGVCCHDIPLFQHGMRLLQEIKLYKRIRHILISINPDLILNYTIKPVVWGSMASRALPDTCVYSFITGRGRMLYKKSTIMGKWVQLFFYLLCKHALKNNTNVFFLNIEDNNYFITHGLVNKRQCHVLPSEGVYLADYPYCHYTPPEDKKVVFLMMARIMRDKGVFEYLESAHRILKQHQNTLFLLAGEIDAEISKRDLSIFNGLIKREGIEYLGQLPDVVPVLMKCAVFVLPSYAEGCPRSTLEAMAIGRPVITTNVGGCRSTVVEGKNGYLVDVKSVDDLFLKMKKFILHDNKDEMILSMGQASRQMVENTHDDNIINHMIIEQLGLYH